MPSFDNYPEHPAIKLLYLGHTGAGKTGSLVSLAAAGYNVRILDLDKGVQIIKDYVTNPKSPYLVAKPGLWNLEQCKELSKRISYVEISETMNLVGPPGKQQVVPKGDAFGKINAMLTHWVDGDVDLGNIDDWTPRDVLVIDGLSRLADAAFTQQLALNGRLLTRPEQGDYGVAQGRVKNILQALYADTVKCNVIMICHIAYIETESGPTRGFPQSVGKAIGPQIGQFFNHAILAKSTGQGGAERRVIRTSTEGMVELKSAAPLRVKPEYDLAFGLAEYFRDVKGTSA